MMKMTVCYRKYDTVLMRQHLSKCLESRRLTAFPGSDRPSSHVIAKKEHKHEVLLPNAGCWIDDSMQFVQRMVPRQM